MLIIGKSIFGFPNSKYLEEKRETNNSIKLVMEFL